MISQPDPHCDISGYSPERCTTHDWLLQVKLFPGHRVIDVFAGKSTSTCRTVEDDTYMYFLLMELMNSSQFRKLHSHDVVVFCKEIARNEYLSLSIIKNSRSNEWFWYHITVFPTSIQADHTNHNVNVTTMQLCSLHTLYLILYFNYIYIQRCLGVAV